MNELQYYFHFHPIFFFSLVALVSLMVGSFLNVVILRYPIMMFRGWIKDSESIRASIPEHPALIDTSAPYTLSKPASHCPVCLNGVKAWQNIPLVSFFLLKGRCSCCRTRLSFRYPLIELVTTSLSCVLLFNFHFSMELIALLFLTWMLVAISVIDIDHLIIPDPMVYIILWGGLAINVIGGFVDIRDSVIGAILGYLSLWTIYWAAMILSNKELMGFGDFKLFSAFGAWFGWQSLVPTMLISSLLFLLLSGIFMFYYGGSRNTRFSFGPFLAIGGWVTGVFSLNLPYIASFFTGH